MINDKGAARHGRKRGRKPQHYRTSWGDYIPGLARRPSDGRWRVIGSDVTFSEPDERLAVHRYLTQHAPQLKASTITFAVPRPPPGTALELCPILTTLSPTDGRATQHIDEGALWSWFREQILTQPQYVAQMTGIEQIGYLAHLPRPVPSPTLKEVGELYLAHAPLSSNWKAKCRSFWDEFSQCVGVETLRALEQEHLVKYFDQVTGAGQAPTYARQRFGAIKTIMCFPPKRGKWAEDSKRAAALCAVLVPPRKSATNPHPITRDEFQLLYAAAETQMKGILLLALNCCMYGSEVASMHWADLDLDRSILSSERNKTGVVRVAVLWPETVAVLNRLPRTGKAVFLNTAGTVADYLHVYRQFKAVRALANLPEVQFSQIRDGAYTEAAEAGIDLNLCKLLAGQITGISDHYVKRRPRMVASACEAIYKAYGPFLIPS